MKRFPLTALYGLLGAVMVAALGFKVFQPVQVLPRIRLSPGFALTDHTNATLTNEDLRGSFVLYSFGYSRCETDSCAQVNQTMREVQAALPGIDTGTVPVRLVTISVDPAYDSPAVLANYADSVGADPDVWQFATHTDDTVLKNIIGGGFEVYYGPAADGTLSVDPTFVLVDGLGLIRGEYHYQTLTPDSERIIRHLGVLAAELRNSQGAATLAYEAAHLFLCYAE